MRINFLVNPVFDGWEPTDTRLGGTERGVVEWAEELSKRGHQVNIYRNGKTSEPIIPFGKFPCYFPRESYGERPADVCINIKSPEVAPKEPTIFYTNDVDANKQDLSPYDAVIHISQWAKDNIPVNNPNVFIVPHGYDETKIYPGQKIPKTCLYASSPDRGLDTLLANWTKIHDAHPDATLVITYGVDDVNLPGVTALGDVDEEFMAQLYASSQFWLHPCNGGELFCITGIKAQAAGCYPIYFPVMALSETVKFGKKSTPETFADDVKAAMDGDFEIPKPLPSQPTIADSTDALLNVIKSVLDSKDKSN